MYSKILVPVDGSSASMRGLREAVQLAHALNASMRLLYVIDGLEVASSAAAGADFQVCFSHVQTEGVELLRSCAALAAEAHVAVDTSLVDSNYTRVGECIVAKAAEYGSHLIVCGTHGRRGLRRLLMGSDAEYILRHTPVPILLVRADAVEAAPLTGDDRT